MDNVEKIIDDIKNLKINNKKIINKGTGAGGSKTNHNGLNFEKKTSLYNKLIKNKFIDIYHFQQNEFNKFIKKNYNINIYKKPDEAIIIKEDNKIYIKIIEKKNQNVAGSVEDKLKTGAFNRREYELMFNECKIKDYIFIIDYAFCLSKFLEDKFESKQIKYINLNKILNENNIKIFYGDNINYFDKIYEWIFKLI
jgi:hypothetical protein